MSPSLKLEVDHIEACLGRHSKQGCWHHQSNLRTLCVNCHKGVTAEQRMRGIIPTWGKRLV